MWNPPVLINQMPRSSLFWVFVAQAFVIAPHFSHLPKWILLAWLLVLTWRVQMYRGLWRAPKAWVKVVLVALCGGGLFLGYARLFALEPMVALLVTAFILKFLEMQQRSELLLVAFLGFFVAATHFLFSVTLFATLYTMLCFWLLLWVLVAANRDTSINAEVSNKLIVPPKTACWLMLQSLPLMLLLFVFVPKVGALWSVPSLKNTAKTGVSDSMSPGDFSNLNQSNEVAFRVTFESNRPNQSQLYWRGLVFSQFDGRRWSRGEGQAQGADLIWSSDAQPSDIQTKQVAAGAAQVRYDIMQEPTQQKWLYVLMTPVEWGADTDLSAQYTLAARTPLTERHSYQLASILADQNMAQGARLSKFNRRKEAQLPLDFNPKTRRIAAQWLREEGTPKALMARLLAYYRAEFSYTLQPPLLGRDSVDEFLWSSKRGFCEHFSSSFVAFMRAAGVPARVVVGYQGGEFNRADNYLIVRQKDAHAWAEVWLEGEGWQRVDPTAAVAPERVERNLESALTSADARLVGGWAARAGSVAWIKNIQLQWDASNYRWQRWALSFDRDSQVNFLSKMFGQMQPWRLAGMFILLASCILLPVLLRLLWLNKKPRLSPVQQQLNRLERKLRRKGLSRLKGESVTDYLERAGVAMPILASQLNTIGHLLNQVLYAEDESKISALKIRVRELKV